MLESDEGRCRQMTSMDETKFGKFIVTELWKRPIPHFIIVPMGAYTKKEM
jgi:hypothetical protein